jgi:hypothetical protein
MLTCTASSLQPHEALLLACATPRDDARVRQAIEMALAQPETDWPAIARLSFRHGVAQCLAWHLRAFTGDPRLPADVAACFERMLQANARRNRVLLRETARLVGRLRAAGIRCLVLKGVALSLAVYPNPALRNFADIDLLVDPENYAEAGDVAAACGFRREMDENDGSCLHESYLFSCPEDILTQTLPLEFDRDIPYEALDTHRVVVEIHHGLFRDINGIGRRTDGALFWRSSQFVRAPDGTPLPWPSPEVMLLHLASHAAHHCFGRLMYFMDIAAAARCFGAQTDWGTLVALAHQYEVAVPVYRSLELAVRAFDAPIPDRVLSDLIPTSGRRLPRPPISVSYVFSALPGNEHTNSLLRYLLLARSRRHLCISLLRTLALSPVTMRRLYRVQNPLLVAVLYLLRPLLLAGRLALALCHHLPGIRRLV